MRVIVTGGGTGGHVSPALAAIEELRRRSAEGHYPLDLLYIGSAGNIEERLVKQSGVDFVPVSTGKLRRYFSLKTVVDAVRIPLGILQAARHVTRFRPDVVLSTGGYVSIPAVVAAGLRHIPVIVHEQTVTTGLANKLSMPFAKIVAISFESSRSHFPGKQVVVTGNPVRSFILTGNAARAEARFGLIPGLPVVYVTGGVQGARAINRAVGAALGEILRVCQVIHQCGAGDGSGGDISWLKDIAADLSPDLRSRYHVQEYVGPELADVFAVTSLVVGRAGAGTLAELCAVGKPSILVPLPGAANDEQRQNALTLEEQGAAVMLEQKNMTPQTLAVRIRELLGDDCRLAAMAGAAKALGKPNAAKDLADLVVQFGLHWAG
jgi:UDP-N-acetylglucosamine--N-acetylmuramyl-(pentapeptide) pyrophosphoryl-undecaprenol N-acetylglucosamine transferase